MAGRTLGCEAGPTLKVLTKMVPPLPCKRLHLHVTRGGLVGRAQKDRTFRYIEIHTWLRGLGEENKKKCIIHC